MLLTEQLTGGVDVWLNTPRRPWEASGTSGMKVLVNGGLNCSELDGWWAEAYSPEVGWALGDGREHGDDPAWDAAEAEALYTLLEREIIPEFYKRDNGGIPAAWVARMRESMARLTPRFPPIARCASTRSATTSRRPPPTARAPPIRGRSVRKNRRLAARPGQRNGLTVRFGDVTIETDGERHLFDVQICLDDLDRGGAGRALRRWTSTAVRSCARRCSAFAN